MPKDLGFTLIEIIITVAILSLVAVVAIPNLAKFNEDQSLTNLKSDLVGNYHKVQTNAQAGIRCSNNDAAFNWSLVFNSSGYDLKADCKDSISGQINLDMNQSSVSIAPSDLSLFCNPTAGSFPPPATITFSSITFGSSGLVIYPCVVDDDTFTVKLTSPKTSSSQCLSIDRGGAIKDAICP